LSPDSYARFGKPITGKRRVHSWRSHHELYWVKPQIRDVPFAAGQPEVNLAPESGEGLQRLFEVLTFLEFMREYT